MRLFHIGNFCFWVPFLKQLLLINCAVDFVEICNVYVGKMIIKASKRIFNSDKICRSYSDLNFGVTFFGTQCRMWNFCEKLMTVRWRVCCVRCCIWIVTVCKSFRYRTDEVEVTWRDWVFLLTNCFIWSLSLMPSVTVTVVLSSTAIVSFSLGWLGQYHTCVCEAHSTLPMRRDTVMHLSSELFHRRPDTDISIVAASCDINVML